MSSTQTHAELCELYVIPDMCTCGRLSALIRLLLSRLSPHSVWATVGATLSPSSRGDSEEQASWVIESRAVVAFPSMLLTLAQFQSLISYFEQSQYSQQNPCYRVNISSCSIDKSYHILFISWNLKRKKKKRKYFFHGTICSHLY